jgi:hypothetical protein
MDDMAGILSGAAGPKIAAQYRQVNEMWQDEICRGARRRALQRRADFRALWPRGGGEPGDAD